MRSPWSIALDAFLIVVFSAIGRASHAEALSPTGLASTAWPFLVSGLVGSVVAYALLRSSWWQSGLVVWAFAAIGGMLLRVAAGGSSAPAFAVVAGVSLAVLLLGWRAVAQLLAVRAGRRHARA